MSRTVHGHRGPTFAPSVPFAGDVAVRHKVLPADDKSTLAGLHVRLDYRPHPGGVRLRAVRRVQECLEALRGQRRHRYELQAPVVRRGHWEHIAPFELEG